METFTHLEKVKLKKDYNQVFLKTSLLKEIAEKTIREKGTFHIIHKCCCLMIPEHYNLGVDGFDDKSYFIIMPTDSILKMRTLWKDLI